MRASFVSQYYVYVPVYVGSTLLYFVFSVLVLLILLLIFVVRTTASDCLEDRLRNELMC